MENLNLTLISILYFLGLCAEFRVLAAQEPKCSTLWVPMSALLFWPLYEFAELIFTFVVATKRSLTK